MDAAAKRRYVLAEMTWPELNQAVEEIELVVIPVGSTEQHGPNSTFATDTLRASEFSLKLAERLYPRVLVAPVMPFGISLHHMNFPGTITLSAETFNQVLFEVVDSLAEHGFERFLFVNGHGGNRPALELLSARIRKQLDLAVAWVSFSALASDVITQGKTAEVIGHACESETSQLLYLAPWAVRREALAAGELLGQEYPHTRRHGAVHVPYTFDELTANGALGDARASSVEFGERIVTTALDRLCEFIEEFIEVDDTADEFS
ncbi:MAG TPA: creatininase family protein [Thermomicrobiaceae bacterium]|nr:creatininase family protein [Thermomicrobiaceae bacterium]